MVQGLGFGHANFEMSVGHPGGRVDRQVAVNLEFRRVSPSWRYHLGTHLRAAGPSQSLSLSGLATWSLIMPWKLPSGKA